jgi:hypothetical protein
MALLYRVSTLLAVALASSLIGLVLVPPAVDAWRLRSSLAPIPDPPSLPCKKQSWPNADRVCLTWTAPRQGAAKADAPDARSGTATVASDSNRDTGAAAGRMP